MLETAPRSSPNRTFRRVRALFGALSDVGGIGGSPAFFALESFRCLGFVNEARILGLGLPLTGAEIPTFLTRIEIHKRRNGTICPLVFSPNVSSFLRQSINLRWHVARNFVLSYEHSYEKYSKIFPEIFEPLFVGPKKSAKFPPNYPPLFPSENQEKIHQRASAGAQGRKKHRVFLTISSKPCLETHRVWRHSSAAFSRHHLLDTV